MLAFFGSPAFHGAAEDHVDYRSVMPLAKCMAPAGCAHVAGTVISGWALETRNSNAFDQGEDV